MKNKKIMMVFILVAVLLLAMVTSTKASGTPSLNDFIDSGNNTNTGSDQPANNNADNNVAANNNLINTNTNTNTNTSTNTLPKTGVESDATLFIFIGVCIASATYAYFKIRKYNNIH